MNWTGHVVAAPRSDLAGLLRRPETGRTGVYVLIGDDPDSPGGTLAYIGEGDDISNRLRQHAKPYAQGGKDFWDRAIVLTSKDSNLTKAHARYLESRFITLAQQASRAKLTNATAPLPLTLPEADVSDMEYFIAQAKIVLPVLGVNIFRSAATIGTPVSGDSAATPIQLSPVFERRLLREALTATSAEVDGEFTVFAGSAAREVTKDTDDGYLRLRKKLEHEGVIVPSGVGKTMRFVRDQVFASPSAAAAVCLGRSSANGRLEWKVVETGVTYGTWQNQNVEQPAGAFQS
jgi:hypothetical protein